MGHWLKGTFSHGSIKTKCVRFHLGLPWAVNILFGELVMSVHVWMSAGRLGLVSHGKRGSQAITQPFGSHCCQIPDVCVCVCVSECQVHKAA